MAIIIVIVIGLSLSMDAFSLSLAYGTYGINRKKVYMLSLVVGIYHFIMPLLGMLIGKTIIKILPLEPDKLICMILSFIGIEMIIESFKDNDDIKKLNILDMIMFGLAVSLDSFSLGLGLKTIYPIPLVSVSIFSVLSLIFTFVGLNLGRKINSKVGKISTFFGGITLIIIGLLFLV